MFTIATHKFSSTVHMAGLALSTLALAASTAVALAQAKVVSAVPAAVSRAASRGPVDPATDLRLTVWLAMKNKPAFDKKVQDLYTPGSPSFHKWLTTDELLAYAPAASEVKAVKDELTRQGLSVIEDGRDNFSILVRGPVSKVEEAFGTHIDAFERNGKTFHANTTEAHLQGEAAKYVASISGLSNIGMKPALAFALSPKTHKPMLPVAVDKIKAADGGLSSAFTNQCFQAASAFAFGTAGALPEAVYFGNVYDNVPQACGWTAPQMQAAYGLPEVYKAGLEGKGQTIAIVDAYGSSTILSDANVFNELNGLPALTSTTFKQIFPSGQPLDPTLGITLGWNEETSLDVEWAHSIAPKAKIVLLAAAGQDDEDLQYAVLYAATHKLGSVISNSYGSPEIEDGAAALEVWNQINEIAAAVGISVNYATGDSADNGTGSPVGAAPVPADSLYATAVGGTSIGVPSGSGPASETGWGNNQTELAASASNPLDPPLNFGNVGGSGGGESVFFAKPSWQKALPGTGRQLPDVSMDADPYTGVVVVYTDPTLGLVASSVGGTSLSCPMFSAYWALANEKAGHFLGQAAPIISKLPAGALTDVNPSKSPTNVTGTVIDSSGATFYTAADLAAPLQGTTRFTSTVWPVEGFFIDLTFGTDTSLHTTKGWDNVTGFGTPTGLPFIDAAAK